MTVGFVIAAIAHLASAQPAGRTALTSWEWQATLLVNAAPYFTWPKSSMPPAGKPFVLGVFGSDTSPPGASTDANFSFEGFKLAATTVWNARNVHARTLEVRKVTTPAEIQASQITVVPGSAMEQWRKLSPPRQFPGVLVVGDAVDITRHGGVLHLNFTNHVVTANLENLKASRLKAKSQALRFFKLEK